MAVLLVCYCWNIKVYTMTVNQLIKTFVIYVNSFHWSPCAIHFISCTQCLHYRLR